MPGKTQIEWATDSWNPVTGCTKVSAGCDHCYAEAFAERFRGVAGHPYEHGFDLQLRPERLEIPLKWTRPRRIFVNSMSDLFHADVPTRFIADVFATMYNADQHQFLILTKRPQRMQRLLNDPAFHDEVRDAASCRWLAFPAQWPLPNVWLGTSVENQAAAFRIDSLVKTPAAIRFLSCEPLLGPLDLRQWLECPYPPYPDTGWRPKIHWVITGGESGPHHRPFELDWAREIRDQCRQAGVAYFHKQHGGLRPKSGGRELDGRTWDEYPLVLSAGLSTKSGRSCRVCGCTDDNCNGCVERTGEPCYWVEPDLCSACFGEVA